MKLQSKVVLIVISAWVAISLIIFADDKLFLSKNIETVEKNLIKAELIDVERAYESTLASLYVTGGAWAYWDGMYDFMHDKSDQFIQTTFLPGSMESSKLNYLIMYDQKGEYYFGVGYDAKKGKMTVPPKAILEYIQSHKDLIGHRDVKSRREGAINTSNGIFLISSLPILTSDRKGPARGTMILGRQLDQQYIKDLSTVTGLNLKFHPLKVIAQDSFLKNLANHMLKQSASYAGLLNDSSGKGFFHVHDINNIPIGMIEINTPRILYNLQQSTFYHYVLIITSIGIFVALLLWYMMKILVLDRVISISQQVKKIATRRRFNKSIRVDGNDEMTGLVRNINTMIDRISASQQKLTHMATHDQLTGLPNREYFYHLLSQTIDDAKRLKTKVALFFIDMNKFKNINDQFGHAVGDEVLKVIAARILKSIRPCDRLARQSGDEFIMFMSDIVDLCDVSNRAKSILKICEQPIVIDDHKINVALSVGVSVYPDDAESVGEVLRHADAAMYAAKYTRSNAFTFYEKVTELEEVD